VFRARHLELAVGDRTLIRDLHVELAPGQIVALMGPTGTGKSTLLRALAWLHPLTHGALDLDGKSVAQWGVCEWRRRVAYVPQQAPPLPDTAEAYLARVCQFGVQQRQGAALPRLQHAKQLCRTWKLEDDHWTAPFATLSGGERQRLYLAIVLATGPDVLLLDEPTSALDHETKVLVEGELQEHTALWVTHDHEQAVRVSNSRLELP
jgi:ABC-type iron transport system FetAB ATPase subunit